MGHLGKKRNPSSNRSIQTNGLVSTRAKFYPAYLVRQHGFEAAAEVAEVVTVLVHLHALAVVLDLRVHSVGALLHGVLDGLAGFGLEKKTKNKKQTAQNSKVSQLNSLKSTVDHDEPWVIINKMFELWIIQLDRLIIHSSSF